MIIRDLQIDECARLAEIDPSFETKRIYNIGGSGTMEPCLVIEELDAPCLVMPPIFGSTSPNAALIYRDRFDRYDLFLVAEEDGRIVGASASLPISPKMGQVPGWVVMPDEYLLEAIAVDIKHRGKGIGRALLDRVKSHCREINCSMVSLWAGFDYYPGIETYLNQGFEISGWLAPPGCRFDQCRIYLTCRA